MIKINLSKLLGERRVNIAEASRATGINRTTLTKMYHEKALQIDLRHLETLCRYLEVEISEILEIVEEAEES